MEMIEGVVSKLRAAIEVQSGGQNTGTDTKHVLTFQLGDRAVRFKSKSMPALTEGDHLVVAGNVKDGLMEALAYRNISNGVIGDVGTTETWIVAFVLMIGGFGGVLFGLTSTHDKPAALIGAIAMMIGVAAMVIASKPGGAVDLVRRWQPN